MANKHVFIVKGDQVAYDAYTKATGFDEFWDLGDWVVRLHCYYRWRVPAFRKIITDAGLTIAREFGDWPEYPAVDTETP